jgi:hypothetical protein
MPSISKTILIAWSVGTPTYTSVTSDQTQVLWKSGAKIQRSLETSWDVRTIRKAIEVSWAIDQGGPIRAGEHPAVFWARHTGEVNSGQVIRLRNAENPSIIVFESAVERDVKGSITIQINWRDYDNPSILAINQYLYSDMDLGKKKWKVIRPLTYAANTQFPCYVTQEYKSTTDFKYIIRWLGYVSQNPFQYINGPIRTVKMDDQAREHGISLMHTNRTGLHLNVRIKLTDGRIINGLLPPGAAVALLKVDEKRRKIGYIPAEGLTSLPGPGVQLPIGHLQSYFTSFQ